MHHFSVFPLLASVPSAFETKKWLYVYVNCFCSPNIKSSSLLRVWCFSWNTVAVTSTTCFPHSSKTWTQCLCATSSTWCQASTPAPTPSRYSHRTEHHAAIFATPLHVDAKSSCLSPPQTLYLASMLIKALWNNALAAKAQLSKQSSFASLLNTNIPMGNKKGQSGVVHDTLA